MLTYARMCSRRRGASLLVALVALAAAACRGDAPAAAPSARPATGPVDATRPLPSPLPDVAARVNGEPIATMRVAALASQRPDRGDRSSGPNPKVLREALQHLITRELLFQEALRRGLTADTQALDRAYDTLRAGEPDDQRWEQRLAREGFGPQDLKRDLRVEATIARLVQALAPRAPESIGEDEARAYLAAHPELGRLPRRWRARQLLLAIAPDAEPAQRVARVQQAQSLRVRLRQGADFAELARAESDEEGARAPGGPPALLLAEGQIEPKLQEALERLKPGDVSDVLVTSRGLVFVQLEERLEPQELAFEAVGERVREFMAKQEHKAAVDALVEQLEARARIEVAL